MDYSYTSRNPDYDTVETWTVSTPLIAYGVLSPRSQYFQDFAWSQIRPGASNSYEQVSNQPQIAELDADERPLISNPKHLLKLDTSCKQGCGSDDSIDAAKPRSELNIPDGGYGWVIVLCAAISTFWMNSMQNTWGVTQAALLSSSSQWQPSTLAFVGALQLVSGPAFGLIFTRLIAVIGSRYTAMFGIFLLSLGPFIGSFFIDSLPALFMTLGFTAGTGISAIYAATNALPVQYFSKRLGLAIGIIKLGGGVGGAVMAVALGALFPRFGISTTLRIQAVITISGLPITWFLKDRMDLRSKNMSFIDLSMFRNLTFSSLFVAGGITTFSLFVPGFYLPLLTQHLGYAANVGALLVAAFNISSAAGRLLGGILCDKIGSTNTFLITTSLNALTMLLIWPFSSTLAPLITFAILNGFSNGAFFTAFPTVIAAVAGPERAPVAMSMSVTGFTPGYFLGTPIAGYLLPNNMNTTGSISVYHPAILYAGGVALIGAGFAFIARLLISRRFVKNMWFLISTEITHRV